MKYILTLLLLTATATSFAQATTQSEFNYIKRGLKDVDEKGMDAKSGYTLVDIPVAEFGSLKIYARKVLRDADFTLAGLSVITYDGSAFGSGKNYYCIPGPNTKTTNSVGWNEWYKDIDMMTDSQRKAVIRWLSYRTVFEMVQQ